MKAVRTFLVFVLRWLPILGAAALLAWDFWGAAPLHHHTPGWLTAATVRDGRVHVVSITIAAGRTIESATFDPAGDFYRLRLSGGRAINGRLVPEAPRPLLSPTLGFDVESATTAGSGTGFRRAVVPTWIVAAALIALPSTGGLLRHARRRRRQLQGRCVACGADLEGKPGTCRACGHVAPSTV